MHFFPFSDLPSTITRLIALLYMIKKCPFSMVEKTFLIMPDHAQLLPMALIHPCLWQDCFSPPDRSLPCFQHAPPFTSLLLSLAQAPLPAFSATQNILIHYLKSRKLTWPLQQWFHGVLKENR